MSYDLLTTSGINSLITSYKQNEVTKRLQPLEDRKNLYQNRSTSYSTLSSKLDSLKTLLESLKKTGSDSIFANKTSSSSNTEFVSATATSAAVKSSYQLRVNQLAKSDSLLTKDFISTETNTLDGTQTFQIKTGDGEGGEFVSNIEVNFSSGETQATALEKIQNAINIDKAEVSTSAVSASSTFTGSGAFVIDVEGTETTINYDYSNKTYEEVIDDLVLQIGDNVDGVSAEKVVNGTDVQLKLTVADSGKYITIDQSLDTGVLLGSSNLNLNVSKEKGASGSVTASLFSPKSGSSQLSITSKNTGLNYRIKQLTDISGTALDTFGLNLGSSRPSFDQAASIAGFIYSDITDANNQLNNRFTFNGIEMQRDSNSVSDVVSGVTFTLNSVMQSTDKDTTINVNVDKDYIKEKVNGFITQFNSLYIYLKDNTSVSSTATLKRDSNATSLLNSMKLFGYTDIAGIPSGDLQRLSQIGITFNTSTGLSLSDSSTFDNELESNTDEVEALFNSSSGVANSLFSTIDPFLGIDGYLATSQSSLDLNIKYLSDKIDATSDRIDKSADVLRSSYESMQLQLASLYQSQSYFSSFSSGSYY